MFSNIGNHLDRPARALRTALALTATLMAGCTDAPVAPRAVTTAPLSAPNASRHSVDIGNDTQIGSLGGDPALTKAFAISQSGVVVGESPDAAGALHAFLWTDTSGMRQILEGRLSLKDRISSSAKAISSNGIVVGDFTNLATGEVHAFVWTAADGMTDLGTAGQTSSALGVNASGQIVGMNDGRPHLWNAPSTTRVANVVLTRGGGSAIAINASGQVTGYMDTPTGGHAFIWSEATGIRDLGKADGINSVGRAINDAGQVAGYVSGDAFTAVPFVWSASDGMKTLVPLSVASSLRERIEATAINSLGEVAGFISVTDPGSFFWTAQGGAIQRTDALGTAGAQGMNDAHQMVGGNRIITFTPIPVPVAVPVETSTWENVPVSFTVPWERGKLGPSPVYTYVFDNTWKNPVTGTAPTFTYRPPVGFVGVVTISYHLETAYGPTSAPATVTITVKKPQAPSAPDLAYTAEPNQTITIDPSGIDPQGESPLTYVAHSSDASRNPVAGSINTTTTPWTYTAPANFTGVATFTYDVTNPSGLSSATPGKITITVGCPAGMTNAGEGCVLVSAPPGGPGGPTLPTPCAIGTYSSTGSTPCTPAPAGSYVSTTGATTATPCAAGLTTRGLGASTASACVAFNVSEISTHAASAVTAGTITGFGSSAASTLSDFLNKLDLASGEIAKGQTRPACNHLYQAYSTLDPAASDRVTGSAAPTIAAELRATYAATGCVAIMPNALPF